MNLFHPKSEQSLVPTLRFSPTAWAKLIYLRDRGDTEVGGFAASAADDPLLVEDFHLVEQTCTPMSVRFDDSAVADYFDRQVDLGLKPSRFARLWIHTHPGNSADPSWLDEATFARVFGATEWAVMFILARGGQAYARLRFNVGPGGSVILPTVVDYSRPFPASDFDAWDLEYRACVRPEPVVPPKKPIDRPEMAENANDPACEREFGYESWEDWIFDQYDEGANQERSIYDR